MYKLTIGGDYNDGDCVRCNYDCKSPDDTFIPENKLFEGQKEVSVHNFCYLLAEACRLSSDIATHSNHNWYREEFDDKDDAYRTCEHFLELLGVQKQHLSDDEHDEILDNILEYISDQLPYGEYGGVHTITEITLTPTGSVVKYL